MQVKDLHIDYAESKDKASVVDNGGALEEDADVDDGGVERRRFMRFEASAACS